MKVTESYHNYILPYTAEYRKDAKTEKPHTPKAETGNPYTQKAEIEKPHTPKINTGNPYTQKAEIEKPHTPKINTGKTQPPQNQIWTDRNRDSAKVTEMTSVFQSKETAGTEKTPVTEEHRNMTNAFAWMKNGKTENMSQYLKKLQRKFSYMTLCADRKMTMHQGSRTLTVHPDLLRKMQQDPVKEAEYTQHLKSIENLCKWIDGLHKVRGYTAKFHHWYIDENGKSCHFAQYVRTDNTSEKLRAARQKNAQALITRTRKNSAQKQKKLQASLQKKKAAKAGNAKKKTAGMYLDLHI